MRPILGRQGKHDHRARDTSFKSLLYQLKFWYDEAFSYFKKVIVTLIIYLRLIEFLHFDIESTR